MTDQPAAAVAVYGQLLKTPLATRGYRGLGLIAGAAGDFTRAAQEFQQAVQLAPTDAATLSDLGYARLRDGDVDGARVPLMKAAELDPTNPKIVSNVALYLLANGDQAQALAVMNQQQLAPDVRAAIRSDAAKVAAAGRAQRGAPAQPGCWARVRQPRRPRRQARRGAEGGTAAAMPHRPRTTWIELPQTGALQIQGLPLSTPMVISPTLCVQSDNN